MNKNKYLQELTSQEIKNSLITDMHMLYDGSWVPDWDSIESHIDLIKELHQRTATQDTDMPTEKYTWGYRMKEENKIKLTSKQIDYLANFFEEDLHNLCPYVIDYRQLVEDGINTYNKRGLND